MIQNVAVIGAGWVTGARHVPALQQSGRCRILGVVDHCLERAQAVANKFKIPNVAVNLAAPWLEQTQAATIGVSPMSHYGVASELIARGKHVLVEKPLSMTVAEGESLVEQARAANCVLAVVHNFQFAPSVRRSVEQLRTGRWGQVTGIHGVQLSNERRRLPAWYEQLPGGLFYDESPHMLYLLRAFGGKIELRHSHVVPSKNGKATPACVQAHFNTDCGAATLFMNFEAPVSEWQLLVLAEGGLLIIDVFRDIVHFVPNDHRHSAIEIARSSWSLLRDHASGYFRSGWRLLTGRLLYGNDEVVRRFFDAVEGIAPLRDIDPQSALSVLKLQHAIMKRL